jgi:hypothetical protein
MFFTDVVSGALAYRHFSGLGAGSGRRGARDVRWNDAITVDYGFLQPAPYSPTKAIKKGPIQAAVTSLSAKSPIAHSGCIQPHGTPLPLKALNDKRLRPSAKTP